MPVETLQRFQRRELILPGKRRLPVFLGDQRSDRFRQIRRTGFDEQAGTAGREKKNHEEPKTVTTKAHRRGSLTREAFRRLRLIFQVSVTSSEALANFCELSILLSCFSMACRNPGSLMYLRRKTVLIILPNSFKPRYKACCLE